jgi:hypothetical protein
MFTKMKRKKVRDNTRKKDNDQRAITKMLKKRDCSYSPEGATYVIGGSIDLLSMCGADATGRLMCA